MKSRYYKLLPDHSTVPCALDELEEGARDRIVKQTYTGAVWVSTVFLMINHSFFDGPPILFETMTFDPKGRGYERQYRYCTWDEALTQHEIVVNLITAARRTFKRARTPALLPTYEQVMERAGL